MPEHDVVVVGGGIAGLRAAIEAKRQGLNVALVSKTHPLRSHSLKSQAGVNAPVKPDDSPEAFAADTVKGGDYLSDQNVVEVFAKEAAAAVYELDAMGVPFSRDATGKFGARKLPGHSTARTVYGGDITGHIILQTLWDQAQRSKIVAYDEFLAVALSTEDGACTGIVAWELKTGRFHPISAKAVVLATGGAGQMYKRTTASLACTGDGLALAAATGIPLVDMEMVQFHPTVIAGKNAMITEAVLAEGARLVNGGGRDLSAIAPRDIVARAVEAGSASGGVKLDTSAIDAKHGAQALKYTRDMVKSLANMDLFRDQVPVRPAAHRSMGGIKTGLDGSTLLPGLYAAGECAWTGVHGANRLGGSTLTEAVVFGKRAGAAAAKRAATSKSSPVMARVVADTERAIVAPATRPTTDDNPYIIRADLQELMDASAGIERSAVGMKAAIGQIGQLHERLGKVGTTGNRIFDGGLVGVFETGALLTCAEAVLAASLAREESRGALARSDFQERDDTNWLKHTSVTRATVDTFPVTVTRWQPAVRIY